MTEIPDRFSRQLLLSDELEVWLIHWEAGHDTGFHDHDRSGGTVVVLEGSVREDASSSAGRRARASSMRASRSASSRPTSTGWCMSPASRR
jgi:hypothetical protein